MEIIIYRICEIHKGTNVSCLTRYVQLLRVFMIDITALLSQCSIERMSRHGTLTK